MNPSDGSTQATVSQKTAKRVSCTCAWPLACCATPLVCHRGSRFRHCHRKHSNLFCLSPCPDYECRPRGTQLTQGGVRELHTLGLSIDFYAVFTIVINALFVFGFWLVGAVLFWRKADAPLVFFVLFALVAFPIAFIPVQANTLPSAWWLPVQVVSFLAGTEPEHLLLPVSQWAVCSALVALVNHRLGDL